MKLLKYAFLLNFVSLAALADPIVTVVKDIEFYNVLPTIGSCALNYDTGVRTSSDICYESTVGVPGHIKVTTTANTDVNIQIFSRLEINDDGIRFVPAGIIVDDLNVETTIAVSFIHTIDSGASGEIDIYLGGTLYLTDNLASGTDFSIDIIDKINIYE